MPELIRQDTEYAMRALVYLALNNQEKYVTVKELAQIIAVIMVYLIGGFVSL